MQNKWPGNNSTNPGPGGVGLHKALDGYAKWISEILVPGCKFLGAF